MVRLEDSGAASTNRYIQYTSTNNGTTWTFSSPTFVSVFGFAGATGRNPMGMHVYRDPIRGTRIVAVTGNRSTTNLARADISMKRLFDSTITWNTAVAETPERGRIATIPNGGGYASPVWLPNSGEVIVPYYFDLTSTTAEIRILQLPPR